MKIGLYPMVADVLHTGHIVGLEEAKKHCDYLIVGLHCCPNYKNPVQSIYERYMQLRAVRYVDEVIPYYDINDAKNMILSLDYDIYFLGEDHEGKKWENDEVVKNLGKEIIDELTEQSTLGRLATKEDVASAVYFLASDEASSITGTVLRV